MNPISYRFIIKLRWQAIKNIHPVWEARLNGHSGMDLVTGKRGYPVEYRRRPAEWLDSSVRSGAIGASHVVTQTTRNWFQNLRTPLFSRETGLCQQKDEAAQKSQRPYYGFAFLDNGQMTPLAVDFRKPMATGVKAWAGGIPVLWDGNVLTLEEMAPEVCDFTHLWKLRTSKGRGECTEDVERFRRLDGVFRRVLHAPAAEASAAICAEARGLARENDYLHNALGIGDQGVVLVLAHGSLEQIGQLAKNAGATHCVVVDNGGSCQIGLRPAGQPHRPLIESYYFREPSIAMKFYELASSEDILFQGAHDLAGY